MSIEERFAKLVGLIQKDMAQMNARIQRLEAAVATARSMGDGEETVAVHPITGKTLKASEVDPRLAMKFRFSEDE